MECCTAYSDRDCDSVPNLLQRIEAKISARELLGAQPTDNKKRISTLQPNHEISLVPSPLCRFAPQAIRYLA